MKKNWAIAETVYRWNGPLWNKAYLKPLDVLVKIMDKYYRSIHPYNITIHKYPIIYNAKVKINVKLI